MSFLNLGREDDAYEGSMFGPRMGSWWVSSKSDPRWNKTGRGCGLVSAGGPGEMGEWLEEGKARFGEFPDDLVQGFMKD